MITIKCNQGILKTRGYSLGISKLLIIGLMIINFDTAFAGKYQIDSTSGDTFTYSEYFDFEYNNKSGPNVLLNLFSILKVQKKFPRPVVAYNRLKHFGGWIKGQDPKKPCLNTRAIILSATSTVPVTLSQSCAVTSGQWHDPYTDTMISNPKDIQIDHMIPLRNAYMTGADKWSSEKRCLFANYLGNKIQLLAVEGTQNQKKGDKLPSEYLPPNTSYRCDYIKNWLKIKFIWGLKITPLEFLGIQKDVSSLNCDLNGFNISLGEVENQRRYIDSYKSSCK